MFKRPISKLLATVAACAVSPVLAFDGEPDAAGNDVSGGSYGVVVAADKPTALTLSNRDVNRIVCQDGEIEGYRYSVEKGIQAEADGSDFFVKFQIRKQGPQVTYVTQRSEFFIRCGGATYTIYASPTNVASQTVFLKPSVARMSATAARELAPLSHEERALRFVSAIYREEFADTFRVRPTDHPWQEGPAPGLFVRPYRMVSVDGLPLSATEWHVRSARSVKLDERMFLRPEFGTSIYTVTVADEDLVLPAGEIGRVVITSLREGGR